MFLNMMRFVKTILEWLLALVSVVLLTPIFVIVALWIYKVDSSPIIYKHVRIGKQGRPFPCYKFRTMHVDSTELLEELLAKDPDARAEWSRKFKLENDPRTTKYGQFLRETCLDELPQLFNVLKGDMSLVGPRPVTKEELDAFYGDSVKLYTSVKPGITGLWQVSDRSHTTYPERVALDAWYVQNWNLGLDFKILFQTIAVVIARKGTY